MSQPTPDTSTTDEDGPLSSAFWALICAALAVAPHIPMVWEQIADPDARGRRSGWKRLIDWIGPWPITVVFAIGALVLGYSVVSSLRRSRR
ncbi:hypothetical protein [Cellulomonas sp. NPDC089187]|uniref:hypothetical protein n=1 Tax=Cellulomonas sp. NPDC089187 TaxID=3154970 RepID=UPI00343947B5